MRKGLVRFLFVHALIAVVVLLLEVGRETNQLALSSKKGKEYSSKQYFEEKRAAKKAGYDFPDLKAEIELQRRTPVDREYPEYGDDYLLKEWEAARKAATGNSKTAHARGASSLTFVERGPGNVAGRTRALLVDPDDASKNTWYAGSASGGIWKTTDAGATWTNLTDALPNLGTNALAMSASNTSVIYAGTGEPFLGGEVDGSGIFKSTDKGATWTQVADPATYPNLRNVTRVVVSPSDANFVVATGQSSIFGGTRTSGIFKSTDGGTTWTETSTVTGRLEDLVSDPSDFNTMYAGWFGNGVLKSTDGGSTWSDASNGLRLGQRIELAVSPVNGQRLWASAVGGESGSLSDLYFSSDGAASWTLLENEDGESLDFLGASFGNQGNYDNTVLAHPFNQDIVYVGGINLWKFQLAEGGNSTESVDVFEDGVDSFMDFINFGATFFGGALEVGDASPRVNVEIRFGEGTQLAHRFTVDMQGAGVPDNDYIYQDYVEVPFQVWDMTNNRQLMASFRDQQENGTWELLEDNTDGDATDDSREYLYVHNIPYDTEPSSEIASNGGQEREQLYFLWPVLAQGATFDASALPVSSIDIQLVTTTTRFRNPVNISDAYNDHDNENTFTNAQFESNQGLHPDQHGLLALVGDETAQTFRILNSNDGGVYVSDLSSTPGEADNSFSYSSFGYNTTQFYGADKAPGEDRYIGGMQDNSTWFTPSGATAGAATSYEFAVGGDGFEALWNNRDGNLMMGSIQFNSLVRSTNGGASWFDATSGLSDVDQGSGPFISRLANSKFKPDRVYTIGRTGVWRSLDFGASWDPTPIESSFWTFSNSMDVEVSDADVDLIWAGTSLSSDTRLFYSQDGGETFTTTENYSGTALGTVSGISPHPTERNTVFALFSFADRPKVLKSTDLGSTWTDISGFEGSNGTSTNGFPDVAVNSLLFFPNDINKIWVGTEIGMVESLDGGGTWSLLDCNLPAVSVYDMKIQDDQIVIATYGRGIWSVTIPEIKRDVVFAPVLGEIGISPAGTTSFQITYSEVFDSTNVIVDDQVRLSLGSNSIGSVAESTESLGLEGNFDVQIVSYLNGSEFKSDKIERLFFSPGDPVDSYVTDFTEDTGDFIGQGFSITRPGGFRSQAIHTEHPYPELTDLVYILKTPITVSATNSLMTYKDVAIIETGEANTVFGDFEFWDFVIVEGSLDGITWTPLVDGYDASFDALWTSTYNAGSDGTEDMYVDHTIDLLETFSEGDEILIRFRLFSDPNVTGWGWMIEDVKIQEKVLGTKQKLTDSFEIFPNPVSTVSNIQYAVTGASFVQFSVFGLDGRILDFSEYSGFTGATTYDVSGWEPGIYIVKMDSDVGTETRRMLVMGN